MRKSHALLLLAFVLLLPSCALTYQHSNETVTGRPNAVDPRASNPDRASGVLQVWVGSSRSESLVTGVKVEYRHTGPDISGSYLLGKIGVDNFGYLGKGSLSGSVEDGVLDARLVINANCAYTVFGLIEEFHLVAQLEPTECPTGERATWDLRPG